MHMHAHANQGKSGAAHVTRQLKSQKRTRQMRATPTLGLLIMQSAFPREKQRLYKHFLHALVNIHRMPGCSVNGAMAKLLIVTIPHFLLQAAGVSSSIPVYRDPDRLYTSQFFQNV